MAATLSIVIIFIVVVFVVVECSCLFQLFCCGTVSTSSPKRKLVGPFCALRDALMGASSSRAPARALSRASPAGCSPAAKATLTVRARFISNFFSTSSLVHIVLTLCSLRILRYQSFKSFSLSLFFSVALHTANDYEALLALDERNVSKGLSRTQIRMFPSSAAVETLPEPCVICLEEVEKEQVARRLPCLHVFHEACIDEWLSAQRTCPTCKQDMREFL